MNPEGETAEVATFATIATTNAAGVIYAMSESTLMLILSICGVVISVVGLAYTIWKGERSYRLAVKNYERTREKEDNLYDS